MSNGQWQCCLLIFDRKTEAEVGRHCWGVLLRWLGGDYWRHLMTHCLLSVSSWCCEWRKTFSRFKHSLVSEEDEFWGRATHPVTSRLASAAAARPYWDLWASLLWNCSCTSIIVECCWLGQQNGIGLTSFTRARLLLLSVFLETNESVFEMSNSGFWWFLRRQSLLFVGWSWAKEYTWNFKILCSKCGEEGPILEVLHSKLDVRASSPLWGTRQTPDAHQPGAEPGHTVDTFRSLRTPSHRTCCKLVVNQVPIPLLCSQSPPPPSPPSTLVYCFCTIFLLLRHQPCVSVCVRPCVLGT